MMTLVLLQILISLALLAGVGVAIHQTKATRLRLDRLLEVLGAPPRLSGSAYRSAPASIPQIGAVEEPAEKTSQTPGKGQGLKGIVKQYYQLDGVEGSLPDGTLGMMMRDAKKAEREEVLKTIERLRKTGMLSEEAKKAAFQLHGIKE